MIKGCDNISEHGTLQKFITTKFSYHYCPFCGKRLTGFNIEKPFCKYKWCRKEDGHAGKHNGKLAKQENNMNRLVRK